MNRFPARLVAGMAATVLLAGCGSSQAAKTAAATNAGFDLGAELASLQASHMGVRIYARMGYRALYTYRLFMAAPPERE